MRDLSTLRWEKRWSLEVVSHRCVPLTLLSYGKPLVFPFATQGTDVVLSDILV